MTPVVRGLLIACVVGFGLQAWLGDAPLLRFALWPTGGGPYRRRSSPGSSSPMPSCTAASPICSSTVRAVHVRAGDRAAAGRPALPHLLHRLRDLRRDRAAAWCRRYVGGPAVPTVGASGGIFGLLLAYGLAFPQRKLMLIFPPIPMPAWLFVTLYGLLELYLGFSQTEQQRGAFRPSGRHGRRLPADFLLALEAPARLSALRPRRNGCGPISFAWYIATCRRDRRHRPPYRLRASA